MFFVSKFPLDRKLLLKIIRFKNLKADVTGIIILRIFSMCLNTYIHLDTIEIQKLSSTSFKLLFLRLFV